MNQVHCAKEFERRLQCLRLQAMDTGGKDGSIRRVMSGVNPQGCDIRSFEVSSAEEPARDFLWRAHKVVPPKGKITILSRSYYEESSRKHCNREIVGFVAVSELSFCSGQGISTTPQRKAE